MATTTTRKVNPPNPPTPESIVASREAIDRGVVRKAGRHKKDCLCANCRENSSTRDQKTTGKTSVDENLAVVDQAIVKETVIGLLKTVDELIQRKLYFTALRFSRDNKLATELTEETRITETELTNLGNTAGVLTAKYQLAGRFFPEIVFVIGMTVYGGRQIAAFSKLNQLAKLSVTTQQPITTGSQPVQPTTGEQQISSAPRA